MIHRGDNVEIVVVEDQSLHRVDFMERLALNLLDLVVSQINHLQFVVIVPDPQQVPGQSVELVSRHYQHLRLCGYRLYDGGVSEARVGAVGDVDLPVGRPGSVVGQTTNTVPTQSFRAACTLISLVTVPAEKGGQKNK